LACCPCVSWYHPVITTSGLQTKNALTFSRVGRLLGFGFSPVL